MSTEFSKKLSALRKEKGVSQRSVAAQLNISQALLSHYEKGIREPGLDFVMRVCEFYDVSADYLLGRVESRLGEEVWKDEPYVMETVSGKAEYFRKMLIDSINSTINMAESSNDERVVEELAWYMICGMYKLLYRFGSVQKNGDKELLLNAANAEMLISETKLMKYIDTSAILKEKSNAADKVIEIAELRINRNL